ncbi:AAA family ATPase [Candidatus Woesearchaeota archaeon]|nr:AAA family ATPase [Candidatus Woesearchaeota archaeon]
MTKFIAVVSGKGGVGKTTCTLNIGQALIDLGKRVVLVDGNLVTPNLALHLGLISPEGTLNKFIRKEKSLKEVLYLHESGLSIIPSSPSYSEFQKTNPQKIDKIFENLNKVADVVLVDCPSGLGYEVSQILKNSDEALLIVNPTLSSVMDGLKTIQLAKSYNNTITGVLLNMSHGGRYELSKKEVEEIVGYPVIAEVRHERKMRKALHRQAPLNYLYPRSRPARAFNTIAEHISLQHSL